MSDLNLDVTDAEIAETFAPFVKQRFASMSPEWRNEASAVAKRCRQARWRHTLRRWLPGGRRTQLGVAFNYDRQWASLPVEQQVDVNGPTVLCEWRDQKLHARAIGTKRVHLLFLAKLLATVNVQSVLEVGCGNGLNLFVLAAQFPQVTFTGLDLTTGGIDAAARVRRAPALPDAIGRFAPGPILDQLAHRRIRLIRGNAAALPFADGAVDLIYTSLALEQMEEIRPQALRELKRVTRRHVAMIEPFREWNDSGCARDYIVANDYFAGRADELERLGLRPIFTTADMPAKLIHRPVLVVCDVV